MTTPYSYRSIDTRDLVEELEELERTPAEDLDDVDEQRMAAIRELADDLGDLSEGYTLVPEDDFEDYVKDDIPQIVEIPDFIEPYVDWKSLAQDMSIDWSSVTFEGEDYLYRA